MRMRIKNEYNIKRDSVRRVLFASGVILIALASMQWMGTGAAAGEPAPSLPVNQARPTEDNRLSISPVPSTILLLHFENSLTGVDGETPTQATGVTFSPGIQGQGVLIDGTDVLNYATAGNFTATQGTIEFWIKPQWNGNDNIPHCLFSIGNGLNINKDGLNNLRFVMKTDDSEANQAYNLGNWLANQWHHIAVTWTIPGQMKTYVDGFERISHASSNQDLISPVPQNLSIGSSNICQPNAVNAVLDELRISDGARSAAEIAHSYVSALTVSSVNIDLSTLQMYPNWTWTPMLTAATNIGTIELPPLAADWASTNAAIAAVNNLGEITSPSTGMATLTATVQNAQDTIAVTVKPVLRAPEFGPIDPYLTTPEANSLYINPVVIIRYLPTADGVNLDYSYDPGFYGLDPISLNDLKNNIDIFDKRVKFMVETGTEFRGYHCLVNSCIVPVRPSIGYKVVQYITVYEPMPPGKIGYYSNGLPVHLVNFQQILDRFHLESYVNQIGVKEIWLWGGGMDPGWPSYNPSIHKPENFRTGWESNMSSPTTGDISNSNRDPTDLPIYNKTYVVYGQNFRRTQAEAVHARGHQLEAILGHVNFLQDGLIQCPSPKPPLPVLFWKKFVGEDDNCDLVTGRCGWTHMPPNTTTPYDYTNMTLVSSDIEDWTPERTGQTKLVNALTWGNIPYAWPNGQAPPQQTESQFYIYWMQNMPGLGNTIPYNATNQMKNWWPFTADWDAAINAGLGLHGPYCGFSLSATGQLFPAGGGSGTVSVSAATGCISISTSNAPWITITSGSGGSGSRVTNYSVAANIGPARNGTIAIADQVFTVTQQASGPPQYQGYMDGAGCNIVTGWAWNANQPNSSINVDIFDGNIFVATVPANLFREDVLNAGVGTGFYGFSFTVPQNLKNNQPHVMRAFFSGTTTELGNSSRQIICSGAPQVYQGYHDGAGCNTISGWAWDANDPDSPINVDIYDGTTLIATIPAIIYRQDLQAAGIGNGYHGFSFTVPASLKDGNLHPIRIRFPGTSTNLGNTPRTIGCSGAPPSFQGFVDGVNCNGISGWAWDQNDPDSPINVAIYSDGQWVATVLAILFRQDLANAGIGNGYHAFQFSIPQSLKDGHPHSISVRYSGSALSLGNSPRTITCP